MKTIHQTIKDQTGAARFFAEDGAFRTAAKILRDLADEMEAHADRSDAALATLMAADDPINPHGSGPVPIEPRED